jgi:nitrite reductase (NADH) large subunit
LAVRDAIKADKLQTIASVKIGSWLAYQRLRQLPPGHQLLPDQHLAEGKPKDDPQSRFINERSHANIQRDGTYSVIPRM